MEQLMNLNAAEMIEADRGALTSLGSAAAKYTLQRNGQVQESQPRFLSAMATG